MIIMKSKNDKESKYPMTYKEFEKRVTELFLDRADSPSDLEFRQYILNKEVDDLIECEYKSACSDYVNPNYHLINLLMKVYSDNLFVYLK